MYIDLFPQRIYKYSLNDPELKNTLIQRYESFKNHATNRTPDGWSCELRTEFGSGSFPHEYANIYNDILYQWRDDMQFIGRPIIDEIWMNAYEKAHFQEGHTHLPGFFSGIHYVCFDPEHHNGTTFVNPQANLYSYLTNMNGDFEGTTIDMDVNRHLDEMNDVDVEEGDIIIFPSTLEHMVKKNMSDKLRITVSFNINRVAETARRVFG
tara:strand:+ start:1483 stop:2109 length:627 start_codon:yes stop_codon:yes gene_type:complete